MCAGRPRGLVLEAFLQQTRQQASVFESSLEIVLCDPRNARICVRLPGIFATELVTTTGFSI